MHIGYIYIQCGGQQTKRRKQAGMRLWHVAGGKLEDYTHVSKLYSQYIRQALGH